MPSPHTYLNCINETSFTERLTLAFNWSKTELQQSYLVTTNTSTSATNSGYLINATANTLQALY